MSDPGLAEEPPLGFDPDAEITPNVEKELQFYARNQKMSLAMENCKRVAMWPGVGRAGREAHVLVDALRRWLEAVLPRLQSDPQEAQWWSFIDLVSLQATLASGHSQAAAELTFSKLVGPLLSIMYKSRDSDRLICIMNDFIDIAERTSQELRDELFVSLHQHLRGVAERLVLCGAYEVQSHLLQVLELMLPLELESRSVAVDCVFPDCLYEEEARRIFVDYDLDQKDRDRTKFLKTVNRHSGLVVDVLCDWIVENGKPLNAPDGTAHGKRYVYLNKGNTSITLEFGNRESQYEIFTIHSNVLEYVRMFRADERRVDSRVVVELCELHSSPASVASGNGTIYQFHPCRDIEVLHQTLTDTFHNKYKCDMTMDAPVEDVNVTASPMDYLQRMDGTNNCTSAVVTFGDFEEWPRRMRRKSTGSRPTTPSSVASSATPLREKLERVNFSGPVFVNKFNKIPHTSELDMIREISRSSTHSMVTPGLIEVKEELVEDEDTDLIDDLYEAALSGYEKSGSKKKEDVVEIIVNINSNKKDHLLNGYESNIPLCNKRPSHQKTVLTKSKDPTVLSKSPLLIEQEVVSRNRDKNLKNTSANNDNEISGKMEHSKNTTKSNKINPAMEAVNVTKVSRKKKMCDVSDKHDIANKNKEAGKESVIDSNNSDTIPDTPNIEYNVDFGNVSFRKASKNSMKQCTARDAKPVKVTSKETSKRNETKKAIKRAKSRVVSETDTTDFSSDNCIESANSNETPAQQKKKRKLYSPQSDFIMQKSQEETNNEKSTKTFTSPKRELYVLIPKLKFTPKTNTVRKCQMSQKLSADELFDQLKSSHTADPTVDIKVPTKNSDVYNLTSNSDSGEDFKKVNTKRKRKSGPVDNSPKLKKKMSKQTRPTKYNKKQLDKKINILNADLLQDERMRGEHVKDLINISLDIKPEVRVNSEKKDLVPTGLDNIEIQSIPLHNDQSNLTEDDQTLNYIKNKKNLCETTVASAEPKSVKKVSRKMNKKVKKYVVSKETNKDKKKSKPVKYLQGEEELPPLVIEVDDIQSKQKKGLNDFQLEMNGTFLKNTSNVHTEHGDPIMEHIVSNPENSFLSGQQMNGTFLKNTSNVHTEHDDQIMEHIVSNPGNSFLSGQQMNGTFLKNTSNVHTEHGDPIMEHIVSNPGNSFLSGQQMNGTFLKNTSNVHTEHDDQIMEHIVSNPGNSFLSRQLEPTFVHDDTIISISVPHSPENNSQEDLPTIVHNSIGEVTDTTFNNLNVTIESSPEAPKYNRTCCRTMSTNGDSPITARYNCDNIPLNVHSLDLEEPARDLDTEHLNVSDQHFIQQLRRQDSSPKKQGSTSSASDSNIRMLCSYEGHLSPTRSVYNIAEIQSQILTSKSNETPEISESPPLETQPLRNASPGPNQFEDKFRSRCGQLSVDNGGAHTVNAVTEGDTPDALDKLKEMVELFRENLETGVREPNHTFNIRLTSVFAKILRKLSDWSLSCKEEDDRYSQERGREFELFQRRHLQSLQRQEDIRKQQKEQMQHILEELKSSMMQVCHDHQEQVELRLSMLREDIVRMQR